MRRFAHLIALAAATLVGSTLVATTAHAQTPGYYVAVPAAQPSRATVMTMSTPWTLRGNAYVAARAPERDAVLCQVLAKNTGALSSFTVGGKAYDADQLAQCNARAKGGAGAAAGVAAR